MGEPAKSKGKRYVVIGIIVLFLGVGLPPAMTGIGALMSHGNSAVLSQYDNAIYVYGQTGSAIPFSSINGTIEYTMTANTTTSYVVFNTTMSELINHGVSKIVLTTGYSGNVSASIGFGTNYSTYQPYLLLNTTNGTSMTFDVNQADLNGNQSLFLMAKIVSNAPSLLITETSYGMASGQNLAYDLEGDSYYIAGFLVIVGSVLANPMIDLDLAGFNKRKK